LNDEIKSVLEQIPKVDAQWEVCFIRKKIFSIEGKDLIVEKQRNAFKEIFFVRVIKDKKIGFSFTNEKSKIKETFDSTLSCAMVTDRDEFLEIPEPSLISEVAVFDETLSNSIDDLSKYLINMQRAAFFDKDKKIEKC
jgi:hypothetical protein